MAKILLGNVKGPKGEQGATGPQGPQGKVGENGKDGVGIPIGGAKGQYIQYDGTNAQWVNLTEDENLKESFSLLNEIVSTNTTNIAKEVEERKASVVWVENITVTSTDFTEDETYADYPYKATISLTNYSIITSNNISDVSLYQPTTTYSINTLSLDINFIENTITSGIEIYASEQPSDDIVIESIRLEKVNS